MAWPGLVGNARLGGDAISAYWSEFSAHKAGNLLSALQLLCSHHTHPEPRALLTEEEEEQEENVLPAHSQFLSQSSLCPSWSRPFSPWGGTVALPEVLPSGGGELCLGCAALPLLVGKPGWPEIAELLGFVG